MTRLAPRFAALATLTLGLLLLALPALAAEGTTPTRGKHDGVIGSTEGMIAVAVVGILVGIISFAMLPARGPVSPDEHH